MADPAPLPLDAEPERPEQQRAERLRRRATYASVAVGATLAVAKLGAWLVTGSVAVLSSLFDSLGDVGASLITLISVRTALRPADRSHRFGHGKAEPLGALAQAAFIAGSALVVVLQAVDRLREPTPVEQPLVGILVMAGSIFLTLAVVLFQRHVVRATGSLAIAADQLNFRGDLATSAAVLATLFVVRGTQALWLDAVVALAIAGYLLVNAWTIGRRAFDVLMDRELPRADRQKIREIVRDHPRVHDLHDLRTRSDGTVMFIELHLELAGDLTLAAAHDIADEVERALCAAFPNAEVILHQEPAGLDDERRDRRLASG